MTVTEREGRATGEGERADLGYRGQTGQDGDLRLGEDAGVHWASVNPKKASQRAAVRRDTWKTPPSRRKLSIGIVPARVPTWSEIS